jgi:hypothetical protein
LERELAVVFREAQFVPAQLVILARVRATFEAQRQLQPVASRRQFSAERQPAKAQA